MSEATIRAAIKARLDALCQAIGRVHDYERWANDPAKFLALFQDSETKKVFGWEIIRAGFTVRKAAMNRWKISHRFLIRGYYGLSDANETEKAVNALADMIVFDLSLTPISGTERDQLPQGTVQTRIFGHVLCHVVEIVLPEVTEMIVPAEEENVDLLRVGLNYYLQPDDGEVDASDLVELGE